MFPTPPPPRDWRTIGERVRHAIGADPLAPVPHDWVARLGIPEPESSRVVRTSEHRALQALAYAWGRQDEAQAQAAATNLPNGAWDEAEGFRHYAFRQAIEYASGASTHLSCIADQWADYRALRRAAAHAASDPDLPGNVW